MKKIILFLFGLMLVACNSNVDVERTPIVKIAPQKKAEMKIYSNNTLLYSSEVTSRSSESFAYYKIIDGVDKLPYEYQSSIPDPVTNDEKTYVIQYIKNHPNEGGVDFTATDYFIQNIGSSKDIYLTVDWNHAQHFIIGGNQMDYMFINGQHIRDYNAVSGPDALVTGLLVVKPEYHDSYGDTDNMKSIYKFYLITYNGKANYYLCFDYATHKNSGNEDLQPDGVYNDWVVKLIPANDTPVIDESNGSVEVNLSINEEHENGDYVASKLSVHVRDTTDFTIVMPIPMDYYCDKDDMFIVKTHQKLHYVYGSTPQVVTMNINNSTITLTVEYNQNNITVKSSGITADVLKYLRETYGDGLTFEVWNYYHDITRADLKTYLDQSTITFSRDPKEYINTMLIDKDCVVTKQ